MVTRPMAIALSVVTRLAVPETARLAHAPWATAAMTTTGHSTTTLMEHALSEALAAAVQALSVAVVSVADALVAALEVAVVTSVAEDAEQLML